MNLRFFSRICLSTLTILIVNSGCKTTTESQSESSVNTTNQSTTAKSDLPVDVLGPDDAEKIKELSNRFGGCYEIIKREPLSDTTWQPSAEDNELCLSDAGLKYYTKGVNENGVAGGYVAAKDECDRCMTVYHAWFKSAFRLKDEGDTMSLKFYQDPLKSNQLVGSYVLRKTSTSIVRRATNDQLELARANANRCYDLSPSNSKDIRGDWTGLESEKLFFESAKEVCLKTIENNGEISFLAKVTSGKMDRNFSYKKNIIKIFKPKLMFNYFSIELQFLSLFFKISY